MEYNSIDNLFRKKIEKLDNLPDNVSWNSDMGWEEYRKQYYHTGKLNRQIFLYMSSAAAVILIIVSLILIFQNNSSEKNIVINNTTVAKEITLPDGNIIWLNKNSSAEYPIKIDDHIEITVTGEAYIEIKNLTNSKYVIYANNAVVVAENPCNMNIRARREEMNVNITVASGAIRVMEKNNLEGLSLLVTEGNYCSIHRSQNLVYSSANRNYNYLSWKTGQLSFDSMPMATVTDILADFYNTKIELEDKTIAYCRFSGTFDKQPIEAILDKIQSELNFVIRNTGAGITISGEGCLTF